MDYCHCINPWTKLIDQSNQPYCTNCGKWIDPDAKRRVERTRRMANPGRNDPCPCGSGKKFKKCCL